MPTKPFPREQNCPEMSVDSVSLPARVKCPYCTLCICHKLISKGWVCETRPWYVFSYAPHSCSPVVPPSFFFFFKLLPVLRTLFLNCLYLPRPIGPVSVCVFAWLLCYVKSDTGQNAFTYVCCWYRFLTWWLRSWTYWKLSPRTKSFPPTFDFNK